MGLRKIMAVKSTKKSTAVEVDTIPQEYQSQDFKQIWFGLFGQQPTIQTGHIELVRKALNAHFRKVVDLWMQQFELKVAGMGALAANISSKIQAETSKITNNFEEFLGYKKLPEKITEVLEAKATKAGKHLNRYPLYSYHSIPPQEVVQAIQIAKPYFPTMEIWAIEDKEFLRDPLVVGIKDTQTGIFFVASWGDDIKVEDLFKDKRKK